MPDDVPTRDRDVRERGTYARDGNDPTLASYLSSLFFLLSVPVFILLAYGGYWAGWYSETDVVLAFGALLVAGIAAAFAVMHVTTGR